MLVEWESPRQSDRKGMLIPNLTGLLSRTANTTLWTAKHTLLYRNFQWTSFLSICTNVLVEWESPRQSDRRGELIPNLTALLSRTANITLIFIIPRQPMLSDGLMPHNVVKIFLKEPILIFMGQWLPKPLAEARFFQPLALPLACFSHLMAENFHLNQRSR